jgi:hypothetical protein
MVDPLKTASRNIFNAHEYYISRIQCFGTKYYAAILSRFLTV